MAPRLRLAALVLVTLLLVVAIVAPGMASAAVAQETPESPAVDNTVTRIELASDGSARWTVTIRTRLDSQADVAEYAAFQSRFRSNTSQFLGPFESRISAVVASASDVTGREMSATGFTAETRIQEVPRRWGIVEYVFTWEGFALVEGEAVVMGDAFEGGFFLAANDTLVVVPPANYSIASVEPAPTKRDERSVAWTGRQDFPDGRPMVRSVPAAAGMGTGGPGSTSALPSSALLGVAAAALLVLLGLAGRSYRRRSGNAVDASAAAGPTDEERVLELLRDRDGRVAQSAIVEAFDWSTSKTSRLLSRMADEGTVEKLQIGRQNLIQLPDEED